MNTAEHPTTFAAVLKSLRTERKLTGKDLVFRVYDESRVEISVQTISAWELGKYEPTDRDTVAAVDAALDAEGHLLATLSFASDPLEDRLRRIEARLDAIDGGATVVSDEIAQRREAKRPARVAPARTAAKRGETPKGDRSGKTKRPKNVEPRTDI